MGELVVNKTEIFAFTLILLSVALWILLFAWSLTQIQVGDWLKTLKAIYFFLFYFIIVGIVFCIGLLVLALAMRKDS
jgi:hypothetical protein